MYVQAAATPLIQAARCRLQVALPRAHRATTSLAALRPGSSAAASRSAAAAGRAVHARAAEAPPAAPETALPSSAHGFDLVREEYVAEYGSKVAIFKHRKTGAECMSVSNSDENKTFGVVFRTPVDDSTGIPHILEHSVLNGSRKYPVKEPFVELIKGSLHTFINAFTYPDRTCYPVASTNLQVLAAAASALHAPDASMACRVSQHSAPCAVETLALRAIARCGTEPSFTSICAESGAWRRTFTT